MPDGCEFVCKNESCEYYNTGFNITGPWAMGKIELIINAPNVKKDKELQQDRWFTNEE